MEFDYVVHVTFFSVNIYFHFQHELHDSMSKHPLVLFIVHLSLLLSGQIIKLPSRVSPSLGALVLFEDADALADGLSGVLVVAGDHDDADA